MPIPLTARLGEFVSALRFADVPHEAIGLICTGFADCVGVTFVGALEPAPRMLLATLAPSGVESTVLVGGGRASAMDAAWINATAAHALDYDDVALRGHPSVVLVPAIIAEAEALNSSGEQMIAAYAAGYEVWAELVWRDPDHHHKKGWHPTGIFGAIAAAAACASLRGLDPVQTAHAIGIGACQSAGLWPISARWPNRSRSGAPRMQQSWRPGSHSRGLPPRPIQSSIRWASCTPCRSPTASTSIVP